MRLFEIDEKLEHFFDNRIDPETGELILTDEDTALMDQLMTDQESKRTNIAKLIINLEAEAEALGEQKKKFEKREAAAKKRVKWLRDYLSRSLNGEGFETTEVCVKFRNNPPALTWEPVFKDDLVAWLISNGFANMVETTTEVSIDKKALKTAVQNGEEIPFVTLSQSVSMQIK